MAFTIRDAMRQFSDENMGQVFSAGGIIDAVLLLFEKRNKVRSRKSVIPSDYSINMINLGVDYNVFFFEQVDDGYRIVSPEDHSGSVIWNPDDIDGQFVVAHWKNGVLEKDDTFWEEGIPRADEIKIKLEVFLMSQEYQDALKRKGNRAKSQIDEGKIIWSAEEGHTVNLSVTSYYRNPSIRKKCLEHYGHSCFVCGFNFQEQFGELGDQYVHVHHLNPLSNKNKVHVPDPEKDLIPLCPNCHAMAHALFRRDRDILDKDELKEQLNSARLNK